MFYSFSGRDQHSHRRGGGGARQPPRAVQRGRHAPRHAPAHAHRARAAQLRRAGPAAAPQPAAPRAAHLHADRLREERETARRRRDLGARRVELRNYVAGTRVPGVETSGVIAAEM